MHEGGGMKRKPSKKADTVEDRAGGILIINRWLKALAAILGADEACVILNQGNLARIVARGELPHAFIATDITVSSAPYGGKETILVRDATERPELHAFLGSIALAKTAFYFRQPLSVSKDRVISLLAFGQTARPNLGDRELSIAGEIAESIRGEVERYYPDGETNLAVSMNLTLSDVESWLASTDLPALVLDSGLVVRAVNTQMRGVLPVDWDAVVGQPLPSLNFPGQGGLEFLFRHALDSGVSTPRMDLAFEESLGAKEARSLRLMASPLTLTGGEQVLVASIDPARVDAPPMHALPPESRPGQQATTEFLLETLVRKRALRTRKDVSYVTLRSWRQTIREHQIVALRAIKRDDPRAIAAEIAAEMHDEIASLFGVTSFKAVVPMPCGHSKPGNCLSVAIAKALARDIGLPVAHALSLAPDKGSSHPARNIDRAAMTLITPISGPVLLIDDVTTSGRHIEEATLLLRQKGASVLALAWVGGDAGDDARGK
jgi:predicted amidophosphoribosyltransferase